MNGVLLICVLIAACFCIAFGVVRLYSWFADQRVRRIDAEYRAQVLIAEAKRVTRAGHKRAQEREWGRPA